MSTRMTASEAVSRFGTIVHVPGPGTMRVECRVTDWKTAYGKDKWRVEPTSGSGAAYVETATIFWMETDK